MGRHPSGLYEAPKKLLEKTSGKADDFSVIL
jgi:hypothetical protein